MSIPGTFRNIRPSVMVGSQLRIIFLFGALLSSGLISACTIDPQVWPPSKEEFSECSGVFAFRNTGGWKSDAAVRIHDEDGSLWYAAEFANDEFDFLGDAGPNQIKPFILFQGDYTPVFRCVSYSLHWYAVIVREDEQDPVVKYMLRNDSLFEWMSWDQYHLGKWIRFDTKTNPLRTDIDSAALIAFPGEDIPTRASKLKGNWMKLEWKTQTGETLSGWIKWRDETTNDVVVWFPYS